MEYTRISPELIKCSVTSNELRERGIDPVDFRGSHVLVRELYDEILEYVSSNFCTAESTPFIVEAVPTYDSLSLIISTGNSTGSEKSEKKDSPTKTTQPIMNGMPVAPMFLPIDELQANVISDLISAAENGNIVEHLKKYLNEDFLNSLIHALSESGLENLINSFFIPPTAGAKDADPDVSEEEVPDDIKTAERIEGYLEQMKAMDTNSDTSKVKKTHRHICVTARFNSLDDAEKAVGIAIPDGFNGESYLFKTDDNSFILALSSGNMPIENFRKSTAPIMNFYNGKEAPEASLFSLLEHETLLLEKNAVEALLGKI